MAESLEDLAASFRRDLRADGKADRTITIYCQSVRFYSAWCNLVGIHPDVTALARSPIRDWMVYLRDEAGQSDSTRHTRFAGLRRFCNWAVAEELIDRSPMAGMPAPEAEAGPVPVLPDEDVTALLKTCGGKDLAGRRDEALIRLLFDTGMRISECAGILLADLDLDAGVVVVLGKGSRVRACPFGARTARALDRYLRVRRLHRHASSPRLWLSQRGPMSADGVDERLRARCRQAGIPPIHAHQFRHTAAHGWLASGGQERDLMRLMGWRSTAMLGRYGASLADQRARDAHKRLAPGDRI